MIGSHNTYSYMHPIKWWMYLFVPFSKCQTKDIIAQVCEDNISIIDIRVKKFNGRFYVCHGLCVYKPLLDVLDDLELYDIINCRILLDGKWTNKEIDCIQSIIDVRPYINFYCGRHRKTWKKLLELPDIDIEQYCGSMCSNYGKLFPRLYYLFNKHYLKALKINYSKNNNKFAIFDFI